MNFVFIERCIAAPCLITKNNSHIIDQMKRRQKPRSAKQTQAGAKLCDQELAGLTLA